MKTVFGVAMAMMLASVPEMAQTSSDASKQSTQSLSHGAVPKQPAQSLSHGEAKKQNTQSLAHAEATKQNTQSMSHADPGSGATKQQ